jgi:hypothetical protein
MKILKPNVTVEYIKIMIVVIKIVPRKQSESFQFI